MRWTLGATARQKDGVTGGGGGGAEEEAEFVIVFKDTSV
jgi:hypothetical protein